MQRQMRAVSPYRPTITTTRKHTKHNKNQILLPLFHPPHPHPYRCDKQQHTCGGWMRILFGVRRKVMERFVVVRLKIHHRSSADEDILVVGCSVVSICPAFCLINHQPNQCVWGILYHYAFGSLLGDLFCDNHCARLCLFRYLVGR